MSSLTPSSVLGQARKRLQGSTGARFWRALEELADDPVFRRELGDAVPQLASVMSMDRRHFLQLLGASLAFGGLAACSGPPGGKLVPWISQPNGMTPGVPQFYATALAYGGDVLGVLVESRDGRPTKLEGNPQHPASFGATGPLPQAAVLELWDPDRSQQPLHRGHADSWDAFAQVAAKLRMDCGQDGSGLYVLSGRLQSPTSMAQRDALLHRFPGASWHEYEPVADDNAEQGAQLAFGKPMVSRYHIEHADVILSLEADFLGDMPGRVAHARAFAGRRDPSSPMSRLYVAEATPSLTGSMADHRWTLRSADIAVFARELATELGVNGSKAIGGSGVSAARVKAVAADLLAHRGSSLVMAGESQPPPVHALAHVLNEHLGNAGKTVDYLEGNPRSSGNLADLCMALRRDDVETLIVLESNIAYSAPADLPFAELLQDVPQLIHWGLYVDETAALADWHLPATHTLENWSDLRAQDGTTSVVQPLIAPLYQGRSVHELLALLMGDTTQDGLSIVQQHWQATLGDADAAAWQHSLGRGIALAAPAAAMPPPTQREFLAGWQPARQPDDALELTFRPDPTVWDGRYANNGWLQELPKPLTQLTWSNAALISPALAATYALHNGDVITLEHGGSKLEAPVWIMPGQAGRSITVHLGYGRRAAGRVGSNLGFDAYPLRSSAQAWAAQGVTITKTGRSVELAGTQQHFQMEAPAPVREVTLAQLMAEPDIVGRDNVTPPSFYPQQPPGEYAWGMTVDLNACIGCKGCSIACQAENNIPVVGADQVRREREMHWIRVDRYYAGSPENPSIHHQPVPCMHCEHAPCELVCPVGATVHDQEGLNVQVYNRCIGTRFCSNNCPYKVRRFNFLQFSDLTTESLKAQRNPDVSVRNRGVMEKCTYCIQRIEEAHITADKAQRRIADGDIVTACQAACPTQAIRFGDISDPHSEVAKAKASPRRYDLLAELNTRPRTSYLAAVRNPNPALGDDA
ncbi:TAT-variant-translocated molybdopterin oxidoreductase [Dyella acidiphila]|uniref:TAT-variant-translocated molybdopterin oxidoreductase n=1 Tax=Dyella acidiphila TaxID=2775866 RepID=A0ABR9GBU2_9GAMM|nr:TAT-variant-translocated molybdopterin oxidoreductase [Dyella acidiphila]MBE1161533.1 TAT-variant-translocated molybdopterin oxidoreductase [Dyella acidiphila]